MLKGKLILSGTIECLTGLHIGGNSDVTSIGGVDNLVIREPLEDQPYIPGSSLKGKLRSLSERLHAASNADFKFNKKMNVGSGINYHECGDPTCAVCRLYGASPATTSETTTSARQAIPARLAVRDAWLTPESLDRLQNMDSGYYLTEVKFENTLDRITCAANPRQQERVPRGSQFNFEMVYTLLTQEDLGYQALEDMGELLSALSLLENDYLGGSGSRGYGQVRFTNLKAEWKGLEAFTFVEGIDIKETPTPNKIVENEELKEIKEKLLKWLEDNA